MKKFLILMLSLIVSVNIFSDPIKTTSITVHYPETVAATCSEKGCPGETNCGHCVKTPHINYDKNGNPNGGYYTFSCPGHPCTIAHTKIEGRKKTIEVSVDLNLPGAQQKIDGFEVYVKELNEELQKSPNNISVIPGSSATTEAKLNNALKSIFNKVPDVKFKDSTTIATEKGNKLEEENNITKQVLSGDPVRTGTGEFFTKSTDFTLQTGNLTFNISRSYASQREAETEKFGSLWSTNLETHTLWGTRPKAQEVYDEKKDFYTKLYEDYDSAIVSYNNFVTYGTESHISLADARGKYEALISNLNSIESILENKKKEYSYSEITSYLDEQKKIVNNEKTTLVQPYLDDLNDIESYYKNTIYPNITSFKSYIDTNIKPLVDDAEKLLNLTDDRNILNKYFNDQFSLSNVGENYIVYFDESNSPHQFYITANPDYETSKKIPGTNIPDYYPNGSLTTYKDSSLSLEILPEGFTKLSENNGTIKTFNSNGLLVRQEDQNGNYFEYKYSGEKLTTVIDNFKREVKIDYLDNKISLIVLPDETTISYAYTGDLLSGIIDQDKDSTSYEYDGKLLKKITKADDSFRTYNYELLNGKPRVTWTMDEEGRKEFFYYDFNSDNSISCCTYINVEGIKEKQFFNKFLKIEKVEYYLDEKVETVKKIIYDASGNEIETTLSNSDGNILENIIKTYDNKNMVTSVHRNKINIENLSYTKSGKIETYSYVTQKGWATINYFYDSFQNLKRVSYPDTTEEKYSYNSKGQLTQFKNRTGHDIDFDYDDFGNINKKNEKISMYSPDKGDYVSSIVTNIINDKLGRPLETKIYQDGILQYHYKYKYTKKGYIKEHKSLDGQNQLVINSKEYNNRKKVYKDVNWYGNENVYEYDYTNKLLNVTNKLGEVVSLGYDLLGRMDHKTITDSDKNIVENWCYAYDGKSRVIKEEESISGYIREFTFYEYGKIKTQKTHLNSDVTDFEIIEYFYDTYLNIDKVVLNKEEVTDYEIDPASGLVLNITTPGGRVIDYIYDEFNRVKEKKGFGGDYTYTYDPYGRIKSIENMGVIKNFAYNGRGDLIKDWIGNQGDNARKYGYDGAGKTVAIQDNLGSWKQIEYDKLGRVIREINPDKTEKTQTWEVLDTGGYKTSLLDEDKYVWTKYYDILGRLTVQLDPNQIDSDLINPNNIDPTQKGITYKYDPLGRTINYKDQLNSTWKYEYSPLGLTKEIDPLMRETKYQMGPSGKIKNISKPGDDLMEYNYSYYKDINQTLFKVESFSNGKLLHTTFYDLDKMISKEETPLLVTHEYVYNEKGQLTREINSRSNSQEYIYTNDRLSEKNDFNKDNFKYQYDDYGNIIDISINNVKKLHYEYDNNGQLKEATNFDSNQTNNFTYNNRGLLESAKSSYGLDTWYTYTDRGLLKTENRTSTNSLINYKYNPLGLLEEIRGDNLYGLFKYDKRGMLIEKDLGDGFANRKSYNEIGQITQESFIYGKQVYSSTGYVYNDKDQINFKISEKGELTSYKYDDRNRLSEVYYPLNGRFVTPFLEEKNEVGLGNPNNNGANGIVQPEYLNISTEERNNIQNTFDNQDLQQSTFFNFNQNFWKERYRYNSDGQITEKADAWGTINYSYENGLMSKRGENILSYDKNGNLLSEKGSTIDFEYNYDSKNRLIKAFTSQSGKNTEIDYAYDALGRRFSRNEIVSNNGTQERSSLQNYNYIGKSFNLESRNYTQKSGLQDLQNYYYGSGELLAFSELSEIHYTFSDYQGSMIGYTTGNGLQNNYIYDAFGSPVLGDFDQENILGYNGKMYDNVTKQSNYGYRDYQPTVGMFTTVDPIKDGYNWYAYCGNDPINRIDPNGLDWIKIINRDPTTDNTIATEGGDVGHTQTETFDEDMNSMGVQGFNSNKNPLIKTGKSVEGGYDSDSMKTGGLITSTLIEVSPQERAEYEKVWEKRKKSSEKLTYNLLGSAAMDDSLMCTEAVLTALNESGVLSSEESSILNAPYQDWENVLPKSYPAPFNPTVDFIKTFSVTNPNPNEMAERIKQLESNKNTSSSDCE
ncbi:hypothetical protein EW093_05710 [Thiospirochaeta perfilievii]|uniref:RHS repeat protein n=1 Tax=Thiospirochaeta perfilievii TaxID=252967 RepID=A0A5C1Q9R2_9SPIO|nr:RHS repeat-associated core domain-containing protein [Thiospirochaeta perfilievii]QEN04221.1 hypothetical protein EW093_05710 [Thiospirochaeta perfilievii]